MRSKFAAIVGNLLLLSGTAFAAYISPVGVPDPAASWGGTIDPIDDVAPAWPGAWPGAGAPGYFYIDSTHPSATDSGNQYGYPNKPRMTIPATFAAGAYVEVHGGPYTNVTITANGTASQPVWFRGTAASKPTFRNLSMKGSYAIFEYLNFDQQLSGASFDYPSAYMTLRYSTYTGEGTYVASHGAAFGCSGNGPTQHNHHILFYKDTISNIGQWNYNTTYDQHGIKPRNDVDYVWILDCSIYRTQGDSVQTGEQTLSGQDYPTYIYIGRLRSYDEKENCVDIKGGRDIIVSEIECSATQNSYSDDEQEGVVAHDGGDYIWVLNSVFYRVGYGIMASGVSHAYAIGNVIRDINGSTSPTSFYGLGIGVSFRSVSAGAVVSNTFDNCTKGVTVTSGSSSINIAKNIFASRTDASAYDVMAESTSGIAADYLLQNAALRVYWGATTYSSAAGFKATGQCTHCPTEASIQFTNEANDDFRILSSSPAMDAGGNDSVYATFSGRYGLSIAKDRSGSARPQGAAWDIGAYEYPSGGGATLQPSPPSNLKVL